MKQELTKTIALLERTPAAVDALLRGLPDEWTRRSEGEQTWTARDVVGHLIHCERTDWLPRMTRLLEHGESLPFDPLDRFAHLGWDPHLDLGSLLDEFARLRAQNLDALRGFELGEVDMDRRGTHPAFGSVNLGELAAAWAVHDLTHLHQLSRILAHQYREAVGPWSAYLGVLQCSGHSA